MKDFAGKYFLALLLMAFTMQVSAKTFVVDNTDDDGEGSLRWAVEQSNSETELSTITFNLPAASVINLTSTISITSSVKINGALSQGNVTITSDENASLFKLPDVTMDSVIFRNLNFEYTSEGSNSNQIAVILSGTEVHLLADNINSNYCYRVIDVTGNKSDLVINNSTFSNNKNTVIISSTAESWKSLTILGSTFSSNLGCIYGGCKSITNTCTIYKCIFDANSYVFDGYARTLNVKATSIINNKIIGIQFGQDEKIIDVLIDSCTFDNPSAKDVIRCMALDSVNVTISNSNISGAGICMTRSTISDHASRITLKNNIIGTSDNKFDGLALRANKLELYNNYINNVKTNNTRIYYIGYGVIDYGSDTVIVKGNTFGYDGEKAVPNENGAIRLLANYLKVGKRYSQVSISNNIFYGNGGNAIQVDSMRLNPYISQNTFLETQNLAISNIREVSIPKIESITQDGDYVYISGKTDSTATIELFLTSDKAQTAEKYLEKVQTNENGEFAFKMAKSDLGNLEKYCFTATAIYPCRITSTLSEIACIDCTKGAVTVIKAEEENKLVNVYTPWGICLKKNVSRADALANLPNGIYIVGNEKMVVSQQP